MRVCDTGERVLWRGFRRSGDTFQAGGTNRIDQGAEGGVTADTEMEASFSFLPGEYFRKYRA